MFSYKRQNKKEIKFHVKTKNIKDKKRKKFQNYEV